MFTPPEDMFHKNIITMIYIINNDFRGIKQYVFQDNQAQKGL